MKMSILKTKRLYIRDEQLEDVEVSHQFLGCDVEMSRYTGWNPYRTLDSTREKVLQDMQNLKSNHFYSWVIQCDREIIGTIGAYDFDSQANSIEVGYSIFKKAWGKGYATEALREVIRYLFEERKIRRVHAWSHIDNLASQKVLQKAGMIKEDMKIDENGRMTNQIIYGIENVSMKNMIVRK